MPLYEYQCDACGHRFEVIQKFSDAPIDTCPKCGATVRKLMSSPAIQFKGSGFYITDYAKKESTAASKAGNAKDGGAKEGSTKDGSTSGSEAGSTGSTASSPSTPAAPAAGSGKSE